MMKVSHLTLALLLAGIPAFGQDKPDKPLPMAHEGRLIAPGETLPPFPDNLVITETKDDGRFAWKVVKVNSCTWCGKPMTYKQATFDKKSSLMWIGRFTLNTIDIELTHRSPCFESGNCREINPLLGQTRKQAYAVTGSIAAVDWLVTGWLRKGDKSTHLGGLKLWWIVPITGDAASIGGIINSIVQWHDKLPPGHMAP